MPSLKIVNLTPSGVYWEGKGFRKREFPDWVFQKQSGQEQAHHLVQDPVFPVDKPVRYRTWDDWQYAPRPLPRYRSGKAMIVVDAQAVFPISVRPLPSPDDRALMGKAVHEELWQSGQNKAARDDAQGSLQKMAFITMLVLTAAMAGLMAFMGYEQYLSSKAVDAAKVSLQGLPLVLVGIARAGAIPARGLSSLALWLRRRWDSLVSWCAETTLRYERVLVVEPPKPYFVELPYDEIITRIDPRSRWEYHTKLMHVLGGAAAGITIVALAAYYGYFAQVLVPLSAIILSSLVGMTIGGPVGLLVGLQMVPKPFWIVRRYLDGDDLVTESYIHSHFLPPDAMSIEIEDDEGNVITEVMPRVEKATTTAANLLAQDERDEMRNEQRSNMEKLELTLIVTTLVIVLVVFFLFVTANSGA